MLARSVVHCEFTKLCTNFLMSINKLRTFQFLWFVAQEGVARLRDLQQLIPSTVYLLLVWLSLRFPPREALAMVEGKFEIYLCELMWTDVRCVGLVILTILIISHCVQICRENKFSIRRVHESCSIVRLHCLVSISTHPSPISTFNKSQLPWLSRCLEG